jgi:uncharacterized protein
VSHYAYLDASAAVKLAFAERETSELERRLLDVDGLLSSRLTEVETRRTAWRLRGRQRLQQVEEVFESFVFIEVTGAILRRAAALPDADLRSLDAIHLATALSIDAADLEFICYDQRLARAARAHGLTCRP